MLKQAVIKEIRMVSPIDQSTRAIELDTDLLSLHTSCPSMWSSHFEFNSEFKRLTLIVDSSPRRLSTASSVDYSQMEMRLTAYMNEVVNSYF